MNIFAGSIEIQMLCWAVVLGLAQLVIATTLATKDQGLAYKVVTVLNKNSASSALGAQIYFWARVIYVPVYAAGIPVVRTLVWAASIFGLVTVLLAAVA